MKIIILLLIAIVTFASDTVHFQAKILEKVLSDISTPKELKIWTDDTKILNELKDHKVLNMVNTICDSNLVIIKNKKHLSKECKADFIFVLQYNLLNEIPNSFGAMFWKKGRPNIVIIEPRINKQNISISKDLEPYLEERVW